MEMGDRVRDRITGFQGIVTGVATYITGCKQACVAPTVKSDGGRWFDEDRLEVVARGAVSIAVKDNGPDAPAPTK